MSKRLSPDRLCYSSGHTLLVYRSVGDIRMRPAIINFDIYCTSIYVPPSCSIGRRHVSSWMQPHFRFFKFIFVQLCPQLALFTIERIECSSWIIRLDTLWLYCSIYEYIHKNWLLNDSITQSEISVRNYSKIFTRSCLLIVNINLKAEIIHFKDGAWVRLLGGALLAVTSLSNFSKALAFLDFKNY